MTPELTRLLAILAAGIVVVVLGVYWWMQRATTPERHDDSPLPLFGGLQPGERFTPPQARPAIQPERSRPPLPPVVPFKAPPTPPDQAAVAVPSPLPPLPSPLPPAEAPPRPKPVIREFSTGAPLKPEAPAEVARPTPPDSPVVSPAGVPGTMIEGHALRFSVPAEGTLQFLPGRFEIGSGMDAGREIRFVHVPGPNGMEVTFGRSEGELYRHIQLRDKTVSRQHARMQLRDGRWFLVNRSTTNPVIWNGTELESDQEHGLADGDRIEMGEVVFTFRSR